MKGIVVAGTGSGVGKTVVTLSLIRSMRDAGHEVQPCKVGPDYIDPSHHAAEAGRPSRNLDPFLMGRDGTLRNLHEGEGDFCVIEGVMGLYDGKQSSTAAIADLLDLPVLLVLDGSSTSASTAATAHGFATYGDVEVAAAVANRTGSDKHRRLIREAFDDLNLRILTLPRTEGAEIPDRHLGLHMAEENQLPDDAISTLADHLPPEEIEIMAGEVPEYERSDGAPAEPAKGRELDATVAVALDEAFSFYYPSNLEHIRERARLLTFSPLRGETPEADAYYLGGGYPELHAEKLSRSQTLDHLRQKSLDGAPIYGECGGMMTLAESLQTDSGRHEMANVLPLRVEMTDNLQAIGYAEAEIETDAWGLRGRKVRGHEFHYSRAIVEPGATPAYRMERGDGVDGHDGFIEYNALGSYLHVHAKGVPHLFDHLLQTAEDYSST